ncbi:MAG: thioredoxin [Bacteroidetes bacterium]|nr:thioredoxin [Bacteroidota bacterium]MDA0874943.1 thioredoxin [Bacteroidota bacterium]
MRYDVQSFQEDVIDASHHQPVVVDFWAPWCGPCRVLGPIIEKLADEQTDRWTLVKVNSDSHQQEAMRYGVRGIPSVKLFHRGQVIDEFTGALPEAAIRQWLEKALPGEAKELLSQVESLMEEGRAQETTPYLERILSLEPTNPSAAGHLAAMLSIEDPERALRLADIAMTGEPRFVQVAEAVRTVAGILSSPPLAEGAGKELFTAALDALDAGDPEAAILQLIEVLKTDRYWGEDAARKLGVALFTLLGPGHDVTRAHRRTFDMWLW